MPSDGQQLSAEGLDSIFHKDLKGDLQRGSPNFFPILYITVRVVQQNILIAGEAAADFIHTLIDNGMNRFVAHPGPEAFDVSLNQRPDPVHIRFLGQADGPGSRRSVTAQVIEVDHIGVADDLCAVLIRSARRAQPDMLHLSHEAVDIKLLESEHGEVFTTHPTPDNKQQFFDLAGKIHLNADSVTEFREASLL